MSDKHVPRAIIILDFGGQYAHLIASRIRRFGFASYILPADTPPSSLKTAAGIILSGGPQSVYEKGSPQADLTILELDIPVLGLCYGHQWMAHAAGGTVSPAAVKEYGSTAVRIADEPNPLFHDLPKEFTVWMSHGDEVQTLPPGFRVSASTRDCANAAMIHPEKRLFGIQFHIEVTHSEYGMDILRRFTDLCMPQRWSVQGYGERMGEELLREVEGRKVFMLVSGGVDSTVAFTLLNNVLGSDRVQGLLVDTGLMRKDEVKKIMEAFDALGIRNLHVEDASERFYAALENVTEPEKKRQVIGRTFLDVQKIVSERMGLRIEDGWMLGQGTIYPDTIETGGTKYADTIKTHHNRVELIRQMIEAGLVVEPLKELYKDEVRELGEELGLPHDLVWRHPFPGPGLGVRILCAHQAEPVPKAEAWQEGAEKWHENAVVLPVKSVGVQGDGRTYRHAAVLFGTGPTDAQYALATEVPNSSAVLSRVLFCASHDSPFVPVFVPTTISEETADLLREADDIVDRAVRSAKLYADIWQFPVVLLPVGESGGRSIVLRPIQSTDAMTAAAYRLPPALLREITASLLALPGIDAVFLDLTNKPPGTIEWE